MLKVDIFHDRQNWSAALSKFERHDYVHTYDFHIISEGMNEGVPVLFVGKNENEQSVICWPALKRKIEGSDSFDLTSVYGYGGPLINRDFWQPEYLQELFRVMSGLGAVAIFSRMHPVFKDEIELLERFLRKISDVPVIDIALQNKTVESYRKDHRRGIRKLLALGFTATVDEECRYLDEFMRIYYQSMRDLHAREYFYFKEKFFESLVSATDFKTILSFVKLDEINVCATLNIVTGKIMHAHLSGDVKKYRKLAPSKLDYAFTHDWAINNGLATVLLGPGRSQQDDTLLDFKQGFARTTLPLYVFRHVLNRNAYDTLCAKNGVNPDHSGYFPAYRAPS